MYAYIYVRIGKITTAERYRRAAYYAHCTCTRRARRCCSLCAINAAVVGNVSNSCERFKATTIIVQSSSAPGIEKRLKNVFESAPAFVLSV